MLRTLSHSTKTPKRLPVLHAIHTRQPRRPALHHPLMAQTPFYQTEHCRRAQIQVIYGASSFHSTPSARGLYAFIPVLFSVLKVSTSVISSFPLSDEFSRRRLWRWRGPLGGSRSRLSHYWHSKITGHGGGFSALTNVAHLKGARGSGRRRKRSRRRIYRKGRRFSVFSFSFR
jgi:hypothetical protein